MEFRRRGGQNGAMSPREKRATDEDLIRNPGDFSLVLGGPLFQLLRKAHLSDDALTLARQRIIVISLLAWLPLLVLAALEGKALPGSVAVPFLLDWEQHIRFLIALPLLIVAELVVHRRMRSVVEVFLERNLIPEEELGRFNVAIASAFRLRNSLLAEFLLVAFVYGVGIQLFWRQYVALDAPTWYGMPGVDGSVLSIAGVWFGYVSLPIFQFLLCRWYFRIFIWARFLWQVSRIELSLLPTHPDRVGGLGFLANTVYAFTPLVIAHGAVVAGPIANRIFYTGAGLVDFKTEIGVLVLFVLILVFGPLLVFGPQLAATQRRGLREYGTLAERYVRQFEAKWLRDSSPRDRRLVGSADIQSLADLDASLEIVRGMRRLPITRRALFELTCATLAPIVPLALTMMPLEDLVKRLFGILL
jgi:hypothetical protein